MSSKTIYTSPLCSCIICHKECSSKGINSHYRISHTEEGKSLHSIKTQKALLLALDANKTRISDDRDKKLREYLKAPVKCIECGQSHTYSKRNNKFCSASCRTKNLNKIRKHSEETKTQIGISVTKSHRANPKPLYTKIRQCKNCENFFEVSTRKSSRNCSKTCEYDQRSKSARLNSSIGVKRSKDEIKLFDLLYPLFDKVTANERIANGWDADILIYDHKLAILWNGPWHYKEMGFKNHSLKQVQNRDKIKIKEFKKIGWEILIFEDRFYTPETAFVKLCTKLKIGTP